jgi:hypothetical protein
LSNGSNKMNGNIARHEVKIGEAATSVAASAPTGL